MKQKVFPNSIEAYGRFLFPHHLSKPTPHFHREIFWLLQGDTLRIVIGAPRSHAKSTVVDLVYLSWAIVNKKVRFVLLMSDTYSQAVLFLEALKVEFENNERLKFFYGEMKTDKWSESEVIIGGTMVKAIGAGMKVRGLKFRESRPDLIVCDDLENDELVENKERRDKLERWWNGAVIPSLADGGKIVVIGTVLHFDSLLSKMLDETRYSEYTKRTYAAVMDGKALWPEHQSLEETERIKAEYAAKGLIDQFYREYMNQVISAENQKFKQEKMKFYVDEDLDKKQLNNFIAIDRAYSLSGTADFSGIVVVSVDDQNNWYVRQAERFKDDEKRLIEKIIDLQKYWRPLKFGIEQKAFQYTLQTHLTDEMRRTNNFFNIEELKDEQKSKIKRIEGLIPRYELGTIFFKKDQTDLRDEMFRFPRAGGDDLIDSLAHILKLATPVEKEEQQQLDKIFDPFSLI